MLQTRLWILILLSLKLSSQQSLPTPWTQGIATNYGGAQDGMDPSSASYGTKDGSCGYGALSTASYPYWSVAALSTSNKYSLAGPSQGCGQCFEIQCLNSGGSFAGRCSSSQSITVTITDSCPECEPDHIDIQALSFNKIAPMAIGRIDMRYRRVDCTPPETVQLAIDSNVGVGGWLRLVVEKTAGFGGITAVQMRTSGGGSWASLNNKFGSAWEISNTPNLPWDFQFTSDSKQTVQAMSLVNQNGKVGDIPTGVQFSLSGTTGSTDISYDAATTPGSGSPATPPTSGSSASPPVGINPVSATPPVSSQSSQATPPVASSSSTTSTSSGQKGCCTDVTPPGGLTCQQQQGYGKCTADWMIGNSFCQLTCGNCPASCSGNGGNGQSVSTQSIGSSSPPVSSQQATSQQTPPSQQYTSQQTPPSQQSPPTQQASTPPVSSAQSSGTCDDQTPPGSSQSCPDLASSGKCYGSVPAGYCKKSCYRC